jgi:uncharacterized membrane protein YsdA (DUF1294 family)
MGAPPSICAPGSPAGCLCLSLVPFPRVSTDPSKPTSRSTHRILAPVGVTLLLLLLPAAAAWRGLGPTPRAYFAGGLTAISLLAFAATWLDKRKAREQERREPEGILHLLELLGGWPGAFLAQRWFRHKTAKLGYQFVFWLIVALHQLAALDWLLGWPILGALRPS